MQGFGALGEDFKRLFKVAWIDPFRQHTFIMKAANLMGTD